MDPFPSLYKVINKQTNKQNGKFATTKRLQVESFGPTFICRDFATKPTISLHGT
jgi:hypothetical protein